MRFEDDTFHFEIPEFEASIPTPDFSAGPVAFIQTGDIEGGVLKLGEDLKTVDPHWPEAVGAAKSDPWRWTPETGDICVFWQGQPMAFSASLATPNARHAFLHYGFRRDAETIDFDYDSSWFGKNVGELDQGEYVSTTEEGFRVKLGRFDTGEVRFPVTEMDYPEKVFHVAGFNPTGRKRTVWHRDEDAVASLTDHHPYLLTVAEMFDFEKVWKIRLFETENGLPVLTAKAIRGCVLDEEEEIGME
jgi:hypothetical protein